MKILLTGAGGFIGKNIFDVLIQRHQIMGLDKTKSMDPFIQIDIADFQSLEDLFQNNKDIDIIIHSAALAHSKGNDLSLKNFRRINFEGTKNLIELSNKYLKLKRFIFFSTISVYGEDLKTDVYKEDFPCRANTPYAITKRMAEEYLARNAHFVYTILRFSPVYGKELTLNIDRRTRIKNFLYQVGDGTNRLSLLNVKNIVELMEYLLVHGSECNNEIYNLADNIIYTYNDLIKTQRRISGINKSINFPRFIMRGAYHLGKVIGNNYLVENSIKLLTDTVYDTGKISSKVTFKFNLFDTF